MTLDMHASLDEALAIVKSAGFRISRPRSAKRKNNHVGPVFVCEFRDGTAVRMTTHTALEIEKLDWDRGERLARQAWASRHKMPLDWDSAQLGKIAPPVIACRFEQGGEVLAQRNGGASLS
jgi:hypothetical protein